MENKSTKPTEKKRFSAFSDKTLLSIALVCCLQYLVCSLIGVIRGYSIQSFIPTGVMLAGIFMIMPYSKKYTKLSYLSSFLIIYMSLIGLQQGKYKNEGENLYNKGEYLNAISVYRKEIDTWYLRLRYNHHEDSCMFRIAQCYAQLENFEETRTIYTRMIEMFSGYYKQRAEKELAELDKDLKKIANYNASLAKEIHDSNKSNILFDLALVYSGLPCLKKKRECYDIIQNLDISESTKKMAQKFANKD